MSFRILLGSLVLSSLAHALPISELRERVKSALLHKKPVWIQVLDDDSGTRAQSESEDFAIKVFEPNFINALRPHMETVVIFTSEFRHLLNMRYDLKAGTEGDRLWIKALSAPGWPSTIFLNTKGKMILKQPTHEVLEAFEKAGAEDLQETFRMATLGVLQELEKREQGSKFLDFLESETGYRKAPTSRGRVPLAYDQGTDESFFRITNMIDFAMRPDSIHDGKFVYVKSHSPGSLQQILDVDPSRPLLALADKWGNPYFQLDVEGWLSDPEQNPYKANTMMGMSSMLDIVARQKPSPVNDDCRGFLNFASGIKLD